MKKSSCDVANKEFHDLIFPDGIYRDRLFETDIDLSKIRDEAMAEEVLDIER